MSGDWDAMLAKQDAADAAAAPGFEDGRLAREWVVPPFTVLDTTQGYWRERRRRWLALGIESELGRGGATGALDRTVTMMGGEYAGTDGWLEHPSYSRSEAGLRRGALDVSAGPLAATGMAKHAAHRREADQRSNLTGAAQLPDYADFGTALVAPGTSIFDPVLCECAYRWWCPPGGSILDPFAGGSVRGIVAAMLGHAYTGFDLSEAQVAANREQAQRLLPPDRPQPRWYVGDSRYAIAELPAGQLYDMVFSCPPYYDLEVYSSDERDLSAMRTYAQFVDAYRDIVAAAVQRLRTGRMACFVVSDIRGKDGTYVGLRRDTELAFEAAGARKYNEAVLVNAVGTLAMRTMKQMLASRKLGRQHQDVLVFAKGAIKTHEWGHEREAPPDPQLAMSLLAPEPAPPHQEPLLAELEPAALLALDDAGGPAGTLPPDQPRAPSLEVASTPAPGAAAGGAPPAAAPPPAAVPTAAPGSLERPTAAVVAPPAPTPPPPAAPAERRQLAAVPGPLPPPDMLEVVAPAADAAKGDCQRCGQPRYLCPGHAPWVTPAEAEQLFGAGLWNRADATPADQQAMRGAGLFDEDDA